jgi:formylmethanofuran dehydrogenase subunit E
MGMYAAILLDLALPQSDKRLYSFIETDGCFADGIALATGCTLGHRTLRLIDYGKVATTFVDTQTEHAIRFAPHPLARTRAGEYAPNAESHWRAQLEGYQIMPYAELFQAHEVILNLSIKAIISQPGVRVTCSVCGEEILNQRELKLGDQVVCQSCAPEGESYWSVVGEPLDVIAHENRAD